MINTYTDVSADGFRVTSSYGQGVTGQFNIYKPDYSLFIDIPLTFDGQNQHAIYISMARVINFNVPTNGHLLVTGALIEDDYAVLADVSPDGSYTLTKKYQTRGTNPVLVTDQGSFYQMLNASQFMRDGITFNLGYETSQGFAYLNQKINWIVMMDEVLANPPIFDGVKFIRPYYVNGWCFAQDAVNKDMFLGRDLVAGKSYITSQGLPVVVSCRGNVIAGKAVAAISMPGAFINQDKFIPIPSMEDWRLALTKRIVLSKEYTHSEKTYLTKLIHSDMMVNP